MVKQFEAIDKEKIFKELGMFLEKIDFVFVGVLGEAHNVQRLSYEGRVSLIYIIPSNRTEINGSRWGGQGFDKLCVE